MRKTKIFNIKAAVMLIIIISLLTVSFATAVSARNSKQMMRDGMISDEGVTEGNIQDGIVSDTPDHTIMPDSDSTTHSSDDTNSADSDSGSDSILGPGGMMNEGNSGINENDFANGDTTTDNGTTTGEVTEEEAGSTVGIVIAIIAVLAIIIAIILLVPKNQGRKDGANKK